MTILFGIDASPRLASLQSLPTLFGSIVILLILKWVGTCLYNIYLHPLRKYPGPKLAGATGLFFYYMCINGNQNSWVRKLHEQYGEVVRLGPDRLSYTNPQAWKDIYGHRTGGRMENPKDTRFFPKDLNGEYDMLTTPDVEEHSRMRKIFSNAFSDKALKLQEPLIRTYVDKLIETFHRSVTADPNIQLDLVRLYNATTFDVMGDLTFGEPLGMLDSSQYIPWVKAVFDSIKFGAVTHIGCEYPWTKWIVKQLAPKRLLEQRILHHEHAASRVNRRLEKGSDARPDIWGIVLEKGRGELTVPKMHANSSLFMIAGTETTATLLSGLTFHLLKNPEKMQKVVEEIRALSGDQLTLEMLPRLPYLSACFEEGLRLYPPVPVGLPREIAKGGNAICGDWIPERTRVFVSQKAAYSSPLNFKDPEKFIPERWLPGTGYESDRKDVLQPFSFGPRNCLGKNLAYHEMRIILASVLWNFDLKLCTQSDSWSDQKVYDLWMKPELWVTATPV